MRPSGVVSYDLPLRVAPCSMTTGTPLSGNGTMYSTYIWLTVTCPPLSSGWPVNEESWAGVCVTDSPPTMKLPRLFSVNGDVGS
jgi:hypothetical protein